MFEHIQTQDGVERHPVVWRAVALEIKAMHFVQMFGSALGCVRKNFHPSGVGCSGALTQPCQRCTCAAANF